MIDEFLSDVQGAIEGLNKEEIQKIIDILSGVRSSGRLFIVGNGGGAGHASHAVCDFRKLCHIDAYSFDNITELTARANDDGWDHALAKWLREYNLNSRDVLFVFSVGGGDKDVSVNLVNAFSYAYSVGSKVIGIIGRENSLIKEVASALVVIKSEHVTPVTEGLQSVIHHLLVEKLKIDNPVW